MASKVHYHLEQFSESLTYALGAGSLFTGQIQGGKPSLYVFTILSKVIDQYIAQRVERSDAGADLDPIDPRSLSSSSLARSSLEESDTQSTQPPFHKRRFPSPPPSSIARPPSANTVTSTLNAALPSTFNPPPNTPQPPPSNPSIPKWFKPLTFPPGWRRSWRACSTGASRRATSSRPWASPSSPAASTNSRHAFSWPVSALSYSHCVL